MAQNIQYIQDHAMIYKFMGLWPSEKALLYGSRLDGNPKEMQTLS
jgi:hypothetical protein